ncbi:MAG: glycosyltransferase family 39 protein [Anaerolineae bacterium]|nr:glycosyltransferase family 39 protein [Anaerolineae bacterium]
MSFNSVRTHQSKWTRWTLLALLLLALALRLPPILDNRFHPDEALYGYWGILIALGKDPGLVNVPVYKPPLLPYLIAGVQGLLGKSEFAVRLPGLIAGVLTVPLTAALTHTLYRDRWTAVTAAACVALSPFAILFSATAFTDPPMVALGLGACLAAARNRPGWAGALAGLSLATKQTGLAWLPLTFFLLASNLQSSISNLFKSLGRLVVAFAAVVGVTFIWDIARVAQGAEGFWSLGVTGYGGLRFIWPQEVGTRLIGWADLARYLFVSPIVNGALLLGLPVLIWRALYRRPRTYKAAIDLLLVSFLLVYLFLHWLWAFPIWDRYLLPLLPVLAILLGRIAGLVSGFVCRAVRPFACAPVRHALFAICYLLFAIFLAFPAWNAAAHSTYPVGGDHGAYDGIDQVATFLNSQPEGTVVYQHWLGWEYDYYLFDGPISLAYWPTPAWLAQDVRAFGAQDPRYIAFPAWESSARVEQALAEVGYGLSPVLTTTRRDGNLSFTVYQILSSSNQ